MRRAGGRRGEVVEHEVTVRDRVEGVLGDAAEAELLGNEHPARVEVHAGERPRAERQVVRGGHAEVEALEVAPELPEVGQQVVREVHRLGALEVGVARHPPVQVALGQLHERPHQALEQLPRLEAVGPDHHRHVRGHLVVARAGGVELPAHRPDDLGEAPLDSHVDVLVVFEDQEAVVLDLVADGLEAALDLLEVVIPDDSAAGEHARVGERLLEVVRRQPVVEGDRRVERLEERVLRIAETAHAGRKSTWGSADRSGHLAGQSQAHHVQRHAPAHIARCGSADAPRPPAA